MKIYVFILVAFITIGFSTCKKEQAGLNIENKLIGSWELKLSTGGFAGKTIPAADKQTVLTFKSKDSYQRFENGNLIKEGKYELTEAKSIYSGQIETAISFNETDTISKDLRKYILALKSDSLFLSDNFYDGYSSLYLRVK